MKFVEKLEQEGEIYNEHYTNAVNEYLSALLNVLQLGFGVRFEDRPDEVIRAGMELASQVQIDGSSSGELAKVTRDLAEAAGKFPSAKGGRLEGVLSKSALDDPEGLKDRAWAAVEPLAEFAAGAKGRVERSALKAQLDKAVDMAGRCAFAATYDFEPDSESDLESDSEPQDSQVSEVSKDSKDSKETEVSQDSAQRRLSEMTFPFPLSDPQREVVQDALDAFACADARELGRCAKSVASKVDLKKLAGDPFFDLLLKMSELEKGFDEESQAYARMLDNLEDPDLEPFELYYAVRHGRLGADMAEQGYYVWQRLSDAETLKPANDPDGEPGPRAPKAAPANDAPSEGSAKGEGEGESAGAQEGAGSDAKASKPKKPPKGKGAKGGKKRKLTAKEQEEADRAADEADERLRRFMSYFDLDCLPHSFLSDYYEVIGNVNEAVAALNGRTQDAEP